jgi:hypothetical protein
MRIAKFSRFVAESADHGGAQEVGGEMPDQVQKNQKGPATKKGPRKGGAKKSPVRIPGWKTY